MTLTRFLTAYIYNPLVLRLTRARMRTGKPLPRRGKMTAGVFASMVAFPTILTMFVSGFWHGAGWQFIVFGLLHGAFITVAHAWHALKARWGWPAEGGGWLGHAAAVLLTFVCVIVGLVFFRAPDIPTALRILEGMAGLGGVVVDYSFYETRGLHGVIALLGLPLTVDPLFRLPQALVLALLLLVVWALPNTQQWMRHYRTALEARPGASWLERFPALPLVVWRPSLACGALVGVIAFFALARALSVAPSEFLYFQFWRLHGTPPLAAGASRPARRPRHRPRLAGAGGAARGTGQARGLPPRFPGHRPDGPAHRGLPGGAGSPWAAAATRPHAAARRPAGLA